MHKKHLQNSSAPLVIREMPSLSSHHQIGLRNRQQRGTDAEPAARRLHHISPLKAYGIPWKRDWSRKHRAGTGLHWIHYVFIIAINLIFLWDFCLTEWVALWPFCLLLGYFFSCSVSMLNFDMIVVSSCFYIFLVMFVISWKHVLFLIKDRKWVDME